MKKIVLLLIIFAGLNYNLNSQKMDLSFSAGYANSIDNIKVPENRLASLKEKSTYGLSFSFGFNYYLTSNIYLGSAVGFTKFNYYQTIENFDVFYLVKAVEFSESYIIFPFNAGFEFTATPNMKIGFEYGLHYEIPTFKSKNLENNNGFKYDFIAYKYKLNQKLQNNLNHCISLYSKFTLNKQFDMFFKLGYNIRTNGTYSFKWEQTMFLTSQDTNFTTSTHNNFDNGTNEIKHDYIIFYAGLVRNIEF